MFTFISVPSARCYTYDTRRATDTHTFGGAVVVPPLYIQRAYEYAFAKIKEKESADLADRKPRWSRKCKLETMFLIMARMTYYQSWKVALPKYHVDGNRFCDCCCG